MPESLLDHRLLETFVHVAEARTITLGARRVHRTQSTVSAQIQRLEDEAGVRVFARGARQLTLTAEGERLLALAHEILALNRSALAAVRGAASRTPLRLGCSQYYRPRELPQLIARTQRTFPQFALEFTVAQSAQLEQMLDAGELDVAIMSSTTRVRGGRLLHREPLAWVGSPDFALSQAGPLPLVLLGSDCQVRRAALAALARARRESTVVFTSTSSIGIVAALEAGLGLGCLNPGAVPGTLAFLRGPTLPRLPTVEFYVRQRAHDADWKRLLDEFARTPLDTGTRRAKVRA